MYHKEYKVINQDEEKSKLDGELAPILYQVFALFMAFLAGMGAMGLLIASAR